MTVEEALRYARMRRTDLYREDGFEESWDHETIAEVLDDEVERLRAILGECHNVLGADERSDHDMLPESIIKWISDRDDRIKYLEAIVDRLQVTADGVPVVNGDTVYDFDRYRVFPRMVETEAWEYDEEGDKSAFGGIEDCFSTKEAAEAARKEEG